MAIRTHPSYSIAHENLGDVYAKLASQAYDKALQLDSSNATTQTKLSMIKELISTSSKPGVKPAATTSTRPTTELPAKVAASEAPKPAPAAATPAATPAKAVEKAPEPVAAAKPAPTPAESAGADKAPLAAAEAEVTKTLLGWANAWSRKDVKAYLAYYASDFQPPNGLSRKAWEAERAQRIDKPGKLQVKVDEIKITFAGDKATARFRQNYTSATLKSSAGKTLVFVKSGNKWLISQERIS